VTKDDPQNQEGAYAQDKRAEQPEFDPPDLAILADANLIEQAMINLVHNAIDASSGIPHPQIDLRCRLREEHCIISVCDNGKGVDSALLERIFIPFFTTKATGHGVGLALAHRVITQHGGTLSAANRASGGAVLTLRLPV